MPSQPELLAFLRGPEGPPRFAQVREGIYRGGQPSRRHLEALQGLGVRTVISLRREARRGWQEEKRHAQQLGMRWLRFPFYGVFGADAAFLQEILREMGRGGVYIHCKHGRDRTSLLVALYRVWFEKWHPEEAWKLEVLDFGYQPSRFYRLIRRSFDRFVSALLPVD
jgi:protein tyrosine/serine phosphatase